MLARETAAAVGVIAALPGRAGRDEPLVGHASRDHGCVTAFQLAD